MADWSSLPGDLLVLIAQRLATMDDLIAFSASRKDWSQSLKFLISEKNKLLLPPRSPWLMLSDNVNDMATSFDRIKQRRSEDIKPRSFFKVSSGKTYEFELPEASGRRCLGVGHGWVLTIGVDLNINLLHPFSRKQIPLPPMLALPVHYRYDMYSPEEVFHNLIDKAALSANPKSSHDSNTSVMVIYGEHRILAVARLGDKVWTKVLVHSACFDDVVFYRGKFYIVDFRGVVFVCGLNNDESTSNTTNAPTPSQNSIFEDVILYRGKSFVDRYNAYELVSDIDNDKIPSTRAIAPAPTGTEDWLQKYLVEFSGDLLLVQRFRHESTPEQPHHVVFDSYEVDGEEEVEVEEEEGGAIAEGEGEGLGHLHVKYVNYSYLDDIPRDNYTTKFSVLKLEESRCKEEGGSKYLYGWVEVNSLGNKSLFIGWNQSSCLSELKEGGIKPNCIYFTDDEGESFNRKQRGGRDMGIYHMESGKTEPILQRTSLHRYSPPFWYI